MKKLFIPLLVACISFSFALLPDGNVVSPLKTDAAIITTSSLTPATTSAESAAKLLADQYYDSLQLDEFGLSKSAMEYAIKGYEKLREEGYLANPDVITICDFSLSSRKKRLFLIDLKNYKLILNTYVAHGRKSGGEFASRFSNRPNSHQSSLGFYVTESTYFGSHGLALKIEGVDKGFNDRAEQRNIVVHGSAYVGERFIQSNPFMGRSFGCPAIPKKLTETIISTIKNGSCFFIYHPTKKYIAESKILNG